MDDSPPEPHNSVIERSGRIHEALLNGNFDHVDVIDNGGNIIESNRAFPELCNSYVNFLNHCHILQKEGNEGVEKILEGIASVLNGELELYQSDYRFRKNSLTERWYSLRAESLEDGKALLTHRDITGSKLLEEEILGIPEGEQIRLAQGLHDGLCQALNGMTLTIAVLADSLRVKNAPEAHEMDYLLKIAQTASQQTRELYRRISPVDQGEDALCMVLHDLAQRINQKVPCTFTCDPDIAMPQRQIASLLYHIAQEASSDSEQIALAKNISIRLLRRLGSLILEIRDDGNSIYRDLQNRKGKFSLLGYRASLFGGRLRLVSVPEHRNKVTCIIPHSV